MKTINEWMIENKIAVTPWQAGHINEGLKLWKCKTFEEQQARCVLYRKWQPKTDKKNELLPREVYDLVIAGIDPDDVEPRQIEMPMFQGEPVPYAELEGGWGEVDKQ